MDGHLKSVDSPFKSKPREESSRKREKKENKEEKEKKIPDGEGSSGH